MLPSFGFGELLVIALLAVIVVGPKDLPKVMRTLGGWMARIRAMGNEFKAAFDDIDTHKDIKALRAEMAQLRSMNLLDDDDFSDEVEALNREIAKDLADATDAPDTPAADPKP